MELDLIDSCVDLKKYTPQEIEEVTEDPFTIRILPDHERATDGKKARIFAVRDMTDSEKRFYDRRYADFK